MLYAKKSVMHYYSMFSFHRSGHIFGHFLAPTFGFSAGRYTGISTYVT